MNRSIEFDYGVSFAVIKVHNIATNPVLTSEFMAVQLTRFQPFPEQFFCLCCELTKLYSSLNHASPSIFWMGIFFFHTNFHNSVLVWLPPAKGARGSGGQAVYYNPTAFSKFMTMIRNSFRVVNFSYSFENFSL